MFSYSFFNTRQIKSYVRQQKIKDNRTKDVLQTGLSGLALRKIAGGRKALIVELCKASVSSCIDHLQYLLISKGHTARNRENLLDL